MKKINPCVVCLVIAIFASQSACSELFKNPFSDDDDDGRPSAAPDRVIEPTAKYSIAIGGVAPGRNELVIFQGDGNPRDFAGHILKCAPDDPILITRPRPGFDTEAAGSGVEIIATEPGVTAVRCTVDDTAIENVYEVTVPPQNLIQILVAEAGEQLADEAELDEERAGSVVGLASLSPTGNTVGAVIRNRVKLINSNDDPLLFSADSKEYDESPPASYYDAVIMADNQFSPTNREDPSYSIFSKAQDRNFLEGDWVKSYDQAVLTAAGIFNGDITDPTGGAFAFRSPNENEWPLISEALALGYTEIPDGAGFTDKTFPQLAPIQLLIHPDVSKYPDKRPAFVFARQRTLQDFAVVDKP